MLKDRTTRLYLFILVGILFLGLSGPVIAPYEYDETLYTDSGEIVKSASPSLEHPLGTTDLGYDVLSRILYGARPTVITGLLGGFLIIGIGMSIGVTAGFTGGRTDNLLMRFTDIAYGVPLIPFAIVLVTMFGVGFLTSILVIGLILWRGNARVLRSQVLQIKERPYVIAARATGAGNSSIIIRHILPNVGSMVVLFFAIGVGNTIIIQAGLAFLGVSSPFVPSWGIMVRNAYNTGQMASLWWWSLPPGILIATTVLSTFMFGRGYEELSQQTEGDALTKGGA